MWSRVLRDRLVLNVVWSYPVPGMSVIRATANPEATCQSNWTWAVQVRVPLS